MSERALRHNDGKPRLSLVAPEMTEAVARVLMKAMEGGKYPLHNWRKGMPWTEVMDSAQRHIAAWLKGEDRDQETGLPHLAHLLCNGMFLMVYESHPQYARFDDRYREPQPDAPKKVYLACPYTHKDNSVVELRVKIATEVTAKLMSQGYIVFSPLTHSHPVAHHIENHFEHDFWLKQDLAWLESCDEMWIIGMPGWNESKGVTREIEQARKQRTPVFLITNWLDERIISWKLGESATIRNPGEEKRVKCGECRHWGSTLFICCNSASDNCDEYAQESDSCPHGERVEK